MCAAELVQLHAVTNSSMHANVAKVRKASCLSNSPAFVPHHFYKCSLCCAHWPRSSSLHACRNPVQSIALSAQCLIQPSVMLQHLDQTPNEYIRWRYALGEDRESTEKATRQISEEEEKKMAQQIKMADGTKRVLDKVEGRRKAKRGYEYEVSWKNCHSDENSWLTRDK